VHAGWASPPLLFGLAPRGVFRAPGIAAGAVGSYPTFSPLPSALDRKRPASSFAEGRPPRYELTGGLIFCGTFRSWVTSGAFAQLAARPLALPGALPHRGRLSRAHHGRSPDFPPATRLRERPAIAQLIRQAKLYDGARCTTIRLRRNFSLEATASLTLFWGGGASRVCVTTSNLCGSWLPATT
jgi:hypothetical protein